MKTKTTKTAKHAGAKKTTKRTASPLATCPVGNAGWCAYPFSVTQLQKRMKNAAQKAEQDKELVAGKVR